MIDSVIWQDENFGKLSCSARLLFIGLVTNADDDGYIRANDSYLRSTIFMYDNISLNKVHELAKEISDKLPSIHLFEVGGNSFIHFKKWTEYQHIRDDRKVDTVLPRCPQCGRQLADKRTPTGRQKSA